MDAIPDHIPQKFVVDFNLFNDALFKDDLHEGVIGLVKEGRDLIYTPLNGGHWLILGHEALFEAARTPDLFSSDPETRFATLAETKLIPISLDGDAHAAYRHVLVQAFSPKNILDMENRIRELTISLIEKVAGTEGCEFVSAVSEPLPVTIFMRLMGFPLDRMAQFREWVLAGVSEGDPGKRQVIWSQVLEMSGELIRERQIKRQDDLISRLLDADINGRTPTFDEMQAFCLMLFIAGLDTVVNAAALTFRHLASDPELQAKLRANRDLIPSAMEDLLRRYAANTVVRFVTRDAEFFGAPLKKSDFVMLHLPAANNDPRSFQDADKIDLDRRTPHMAFGVGPHRCIGSHLARLELRVLMEEWFKRLPPFSLDAAHLWTYHTGFVFSVDSLHLLFSEAETAGRLGAAA